MQCIILAGGKGSRLGDLGVDRPKHLVPVLGRPFADLQLDWLARSGVKRVLYCIGHLGHLIVDHVGSGRRFGVDVTYCDEGTDLRGTGGGLRLALDRGLLEDRFLVLYGDSYLRVDLREMWAFATSTHTAATMAIFRNDGQFDTSNVQFENGRLVLYDKGAVGRGTGRQMNYIDYGISVIDRDAIRRIPPGVPFDLAELQSTLSGEGQMSGFVVHERFYEVGTPEGILELERFLAAQEGRT